MLCVTRFMQYTSYITAYHVVTYILDCNCNGVAIAMVVGYMYCNCNMYDLMYSVHFVW